MGIIKYMGIMVKALAISLRSGNSTFAPSGWFMRMHGNIYMYYLEMSYSALSKNFSISPGLYCPVESGNEILRHTSKTR